MGQGLGRSLGSGRRGVCRGIRGSRIWGDGDREIGADHDRAARVTPRRRSRRHHKVLPGHGTWSVAPRPARWHMRRHLWRPRGRRRAACRLVCAVAAVGAASLGCGGGQLRRRRLLELLLLLRRRRLLLRGRLLRGRRLARGCCPLLGCGGARLGLGRGSTGQEAHHTRANRRGSGLASSAAVAWPMHVWPSLRCGASLASGVALAWPTSVAVASVRAAVGSQPVRC